MSRPDSLKAFIDSQLATKGFGNVSEYVRSLLRNAQAKTGTLPVCATDRVYGKNL